MQTTTVTFEGDVHERLKRAAIDEGASLKVVVNEAAREYLAKRDRKYSKNLKSCDRNATA